ncbi:MAG TPA: glycoside hydrolase family 2 TIM barrel-domain containing protein, partial [Micromonosporaceae bacterium]
YEPGSERPNYNDSGFEPVTLPHTVAPLSWRDWNPATWERVWIYRRHFDGAGLGGRRVLVDFDGVMTAAMAVLNDRVTDSHAGGYLPWSVELTDGIVPGDNVLAIIVDARCLAVPPISPRRGPGSIDFLQPGGIYRDAAFRVVPNAYLTDVFARPADVLTDARRVDVSCTIDAREARHGANLTVELLDGAEVLATATQQANLPNGTSTVDATLSNVGDVELWSPDSPNLYIVRATLRAPDGGTHAAERRIGFREASFRPDGFYLNGTRLQIFGLDRHQLFPYVGMAAPARVQRRDAEILKSDLNCNMVRCSHYPQSPHFLDACDELGLMVWEETPGWGRIGNDAAWESAVLRNVADMVVRDRSRPSVIAWGTRVNEAASNPTLYRRTRRVAYQLDGSRPTTGAMRVHSTAGWTEDVFAFDDYHSRGGNAELMPPVPGVPYLVSEAVGALAGAPRYRWIDSAETLGTQARMHAQVHNLARSDPRYAGLLGWAAFDYASMNGGDRVWHNLKTPGVLDTFRVPKPGAAIYRSQVDPAVRAVIAPTFFWGGLASPRSGATVPAATERGVRHDAMIATNCERLEISVGERHVATATPDTTRFGHLAYPPVFVDIPAVHAAAADVPSAGAALPDLRIDGYVGDRLAATLHMSADTNRDRLALTVDDPVIEGDGSDATRVTCRAVDEYGNQRAIVDGDVT